MKHLLIILVALMLCQCSRAPKEKKYLQLQEVDSSYIEKPLLDVLRQYEETYPKDSNILIYFNLESELVSMFGDGTYFTIGEFEIPYFEEKLEMRCRYFPLYFFKMGEKTIYVVPQTNALLAPKYTTDYLKRNSWLKNYFDKATHDGWLVQYNTKRQYNIISKKCILFLGIPWSYFGRIGF